MDDNFVRICPIVLYIVQGIGLVGVICVTLRCPRQAHDKHKTYKVFDARLQLVRISRAQYLLAIIDLWRLLS